MEAPALLRPFIALAAVCLELDLVSGHDTGIELIRIGLAAHRDAGGQFLVRRYGVAQCEGSTAAQPVGVGGILEGECGQVWNGA